MKLLKVAKMGNDSSHLSGLEVNEKAIEIKDFWAHYHATVNDSGYFFNVKGYGSISVFKSEAAVLGSVSSNHTPLEKCAINLMKYRHPAILRYVWHWQQRGVQYLATEPVQPLTQALPLQDPLQVCIGLNQIAQALDFLHTNASLSHNNVCIGSIYVLSDGCWKLGSLEFVKPFSEMTPAFLKQTKKFRYDKALDPNEENSDDLTTVDQFAFSTLVNDVFKGRSNDDIPYWDAFKNYCHQDLQNPIASQRPKFSSTLKHDFFNHEFITVHKFLTALPVKTEAEKTNFFGNLLDKLRTFNEDIVAKQLSGPLLSRLVLLDATAREKLLPHILVPKLDDGSSTDSGLFSLNVFKEHITPQLLKMFRVRDVQVRLLLLKHFSGFSSAFDKDDLTAHVLPELLLGIKDTSNTLVSMTLYCLADLVPILGAAAVIGGKRSKLFADGRPLSHPRIKAETMIPHKPKQKSTNPCHLPQIAESSDEDIKETKLKATSIRESRVLQIEKNVGIARSDVNFGSGDSLEMESVLFLHERPSPDGGEDLDNEVLLNTVNDILDPGEEHWSDWETEENRDDVSIDNATFSNELQDTISKDESRTTNNKNSEDNFESKSKVESPTISSKSNSFYLQKAALEAKAKKLADISELDIKNQKFKPHGSGSLDKDEFNFFLDMEPVIEKTNVFEIQQPLESRQPLNFEQTMTILNNAITNSTLNHVDVIHKDISQKLTFAPKDNDEGKTDNDAWGDGDWED